MSQRKSSVLSNEPSRANSGGSKSARTSRRTSSTGGGTARTSTEHRDKPIYQEIMERMLARINSGEFEVGSLIPSEHQLLEEFSVSRMTVNRALKGLEAQGYVNRVQGVGTFVADLRPQSSLLDVQDIARDIEQRGHQHRSKVIRIMTLAAEPVIAGALEIEVGQSVSHSVLVHYEDNVPVQLEERYVIEQFAPDYLAQQFVDETPYNYLTRQGSISEVEHALHAALPSDDHAALLELGSQEPCLVLTRRTWTENQVVTYGRFFYPGTRYRLFSHYSLK